MKAEHTPNLSEQNILASLYPQNGFRVVTAHVPVRSTLINRNITVLGHRTSIRLEPEMWRALKDIADREQTTIHRLCSLVQIKKAPESSLTAAIRVFLMLYYRAAATDEGHKRAGHGNFEAMKRRTRVTDADLQGLTSQYINLT